MKTKTERSNAACSAVLAHSTYASIQDESFETKIEVLLKGMKCLCEEYGVNYSQTENCEPEDIALDNSKNDGLTKDVRFAERERVVIPLHKTF